MLTKLKSVLLVFVCAAVVLQLTGCIYGYDRHGRRSHDEGRGHHERGPDHAELDIRVH